MKKSRLLCLVLIAALFASACGAPTGNQGEATPPSGQETPAPQESPSPPEIDDQGVSMMLSDMLGNQFEVKGAPSRVVCLSPATAEILYELGLESAIIGLGVNCDYPEATLDVPKVQGVDEIIAMEPDMVFLADDPELTAALQAAGITTVCTEGMTYGDVYSAIALIAQIMGGDASSLIQRMQDEVQEASAQAERLMPQTVYYIESIAQDEHMTAGKDSFVCELIRMAGGIPVSGEGQGLWPVYTMETLKQLDPQVILISGAYSLSNVIKMDGFQDLTAVKEGRIYSVDAVLVNRPGPRIAQGVQEIYQALEQSELS